MAEEEIELEEEVIEEEGLREKLKKMRDDLKACRKDKEEYLAGWQRAKADFINARKEEERSRETFVKFAQASVLLEFLKIADSLEMAMKHGGSDGIKQIYSQVKDILKQHRVIEIESEGKKFNPAEHEAIDKVEINDPEKENIIIENLQKGWRLHDKVLRPAKVKVGIYKKN
ncbi:nucleotide exchange factor GrpE [Candidatus Giovannonibacteria bacterium RIFCSPLOWO2_02_FULL_43_11b]|uniref:Protein GrpE n=1 Tax=Candidatus Giovannonibacteria bacterium RIFCSPHIGHO2_12_FULL_43_15 TaxID=1798341 RepID=A0A1F5WN82_9BACT|nr:MAG: nucleotide exchange factor GrpE [Candidatus Giovannonibacteria bacterium RIFCSPHIGHO2_01_FULL_43_100]OGF67532.1 MAG: nucleotide exchange factor GrpE [Candidatus Giovannonibacteria bacterium RIFCSPHIGHO2_02_FULL_43_32]OGF77172.1 MAG: nucleotide exchange factor GrpE [Candidatus Giovannonibacteria bacterium RIFCSPHIGHO2_12_FULL_43_15]OGF78917.1 MAG: nucleotide exchange factor GrpE [Candidatus Giovannonibacteria bacterium RIFCSPLOWO2_01_FULL_43_60]OGF89018.1 MAG: nucleotide exchange factor 